MTRIGVLLLTAFTSSAWGAWDPSPIDGWKAIRFTGETVYRQQADCVHAEANGSASGLIRAVDTSLKQAPTLSWSWKAAAPLAPVRSAAEKSKAGDDFLARVYVIREGFLPWQTRAINYVWSRQHPVGSHWPNPFTGNAIMVVVQSGDDGLGEWHSFERDVAADFRRFHDMNLDQVDAVAVMTDADNTGGRAEACYRLPLFR